MIPPELPDEMAISAITLAELSQARIYGRVTAAVIAVGRKPRRRTADLMIAAIAIAEDLPLFTVLLLRSRSMHRPRPVPAPGLV